MRIYLVQALKDRREYLGINNPVARERKAIRDIRSSDDYNGEKIIYHPYDR